MTPEDRARDVIRHVPRSSDLGGDQIEALIAGIAGALKAEQERCCGIVYGQCASDTTAERTVKAIRSGKP